MWTTFHRARRRFGGTGPAVAVPSAEAVAPTPRHVEDIVIVFGRPEIDRLRHALIAALGDRVDQPNSPARIESALVLLLGNADAPGRPHVLRRPAGVSSPESWEIRLDGAEPASGTALRDAGRSGRFSS